MVNNTSYLLSVLSDEQESEKLNEVLCYYINMTEDNQIIRAINAAKCYLDCLVFPKERILFTSVPNSQLEIYGSSDNGEKTSMIDCKSLYIY